MVRALQIYPKLLECVICSDFFVNTVVVGPGTHLVKNCESLSPEPLSPSSKNKESLGLL